MWVIYQAGYQPEIMESKRVFKAVPCKVKDLPYRSVVARLSLKNCKLRALVAASYRIFSTFVGDKVPLFSQMDKGSFHCEVCTFPKVGHGKQPASRTFTMPEASKD